jgi:protein-histidine N-methyltransferase
VISYTPIRIPVTRTDKTEVILPRRDLFDVRFQLLNNDDDGDYDDKEKNKPSTQPELEFVDAPSDLIPGVYEGGLKSWECSIDLAAYLAHAVHLDDIRGKCVFEVCVPPSLSFQWMIDLHAYR